MATTIPVYQNILFPTSIATTAKGASARFKNRRVEGEGGDLNIVAVWERHLGYWSIESIPFEECNSAAIPPEDIQKVIDMFWWSRGGKGFLFRPPGGFMVRAGQGVISGGVYYRRYTAASGQFYDRQVIPDPATLVASGSTWTGELRVPVVFNMDELEEEMGGEGDLMSLPAIELVEVANYTLV